MASCGDDTTATPTSATGSSGASSGSGSMGMADSTTTDGLDTSGTMGPVMGCGDGMLEVDEQCDDGNAEDGDGCSAACLVEEGFLCEGQPSECIVICGDGMIRGDEECDDDNVLGDDGCSAECVVEPGYACEQMPSECASVCGDGIIIGLMEACDDGNLADGDGCSAACEVEDGFACTDEPSACDGICGDGQILGSEECDDFDVSPDDGCSDTCTVEPGWSCAMEPSVCMTGCGDGITAGMEECDDMDLEDGDGCSAACEIESGWVCMGDPSVCMTECGDGLVAGLEECDDGAVAMGDGCSDTCTLEMGYACEGEPSMCDTVCSDGLVVGAEACDDGNLSEGDGCGLACQPEFGWTCAGAPSVCTLAAVLDRVVLGVDGGCVLTTLGELGCFGINSQSEVGIGIDNVEIHIPTFTLDNVIAFTSGEEHNCAVRGGGTAWCWGDNSQTQVGPNGMGTIDEPLPIEVPGMPPLVDIDAGDDHNCGLDMAGDVWCWGDNDRRQLGRGGVDVTDDPTPLQVALPGGLAAIDLGMGDDHSCVVLSDNTVACWGKDDNGQLGNGGLNEDSGDATVVPGLASIVDVESGDDHSCARNDLGELFCWGDNVDGQLGDDNNPFDSDAPVPVALPAAIEDLSLGDDFSCALLVNDEIYCWGEGADYQLASGDLIDVTTPALVMDLPAVDLVSIDAGGRGVCAVSAAGARYCWGYSETGNLGIAPINQLELSLVDFSGPVQQVVLSKPEYRGVICGVMGDDTIECSGDSTIVSGSDFSGAVGLFEPITYHLVTPTPMPLVSDVQGMDIGDGFACVRTSVDVQCWGDNSQRQLGQGGTSTVDIPVPNPVMGLGVVDEIELGNQFACVRTGGTVQCWGDNSGLQTGDPSATTDQSLPVEIPGLADAVDIDAGEDHACALRATGVVSCWGEDGFGQLGDDDGMTADSSSPVDVMGLPGAVTQISLGRDHSCALAGGEVYCWGRNLYGNLGQGDQINSDIALLVPGLAGITQIAAGYNYVCALDGAGDMSCWGYALDGNLGDGGEVVTGLDEVRSPQPFAAASGILDLVSGNGTTCVETMAGWSCLGFRSSGHLGNGTTSEPAVPTLMMFGL
ncbi:MAG: DUF4215 domain-containing protein [Myxococcota bacterium]